MMNYFRKEENLTLVLDYLFKPKFGASLPVLKVEIGSLLRDRDNLLCRGGGHSVENNPNKVCVV